MKQTNENWCLQNHMNKHVPRSTAILTLITASLLFTTAALAQMPTSPWKKGAPFPEPDEELYGVAVERQTLRDWRLGRWQGSRRQLRVRPGDRQVDEEEPDAAAGAPCGACRGERQDLRVWRLRRPGEHRRSRSVPHGNPSPTRGSSIRRPIHGSRSRRCPASAVRRSPRKSAARST